MNKILVYTGFNGDRKPIYACERGPHLYVKMLCLRINYTLNSYNINTTMQLNNKQLYAIFTIVFGIDQFNWNEV